MRGFAKAPWRPVRDGVLIRVRLTPRASRDAVEGIMETADGPAIAVRVRAVPEDGAANAALEAVLARWLGCARRDVSLAAGHKSRVKSVAIAGEAGDLGSRLSDLLDRLAAVGSSDEEG